MSVLTVVYEDESAARFRPLSWSLPVYELRCGIFNLRERVAMIHEEEEFRGNRIGLLPRGILADFAAPKGVISGSAEVAAACGDATSVLLLSARFGADAAALRELLRAAGEGALLNCSDAYGPVALVVEAARGHEAVETWIRWNGECGKVRCWRDPAIPVPRLPIASAAPDKEAPEPRPKIFNLADDGSAAAAALRRRVEELTTSGGSVAFGHLWDLIPAVGPTVGMDVAWAVARGGILPRAPFGIESCGEDGALSPSWLLGGNWSPAGDATAGVERRGEGEIWLGTGVDLGPGTVLDTRHGPIALDHGVAIEGVAYLQGPLYVGPGSLVKAGSRIYGETSIGAVCKVSGEIAESTFLDFGNKQHDGFIGHAYLGSWINLGAGTTCSDLKNNYGPVRVDQGGGPVDTGQRFVGLMMGEHAKTAIGTQFNTGTSVGFSSNVFAAGFPPKYLPNFTWGADPEGQPYAVERAIETARVVMKRRDCAFTPAHEALFAALAR